MSPRSIRRAERRHAKLAQKEIGQLAQNEAAADSLLPLASAAAAAAPALEPREEETVLSVPSAARVAANQANAQRSTGPRTAEGKAVSSKNALKTGLTGNTVLLSSNDAERYAQHIASCDQTYKPETEQERALVQALADTTWRLDRIPGIEYALYLKGAVEFAARVTETDPDQRAALLQVETFIGYERHFRNLTLQESRLHRQRAKLLEELTRLQTERRQKEAATMRAAAKLYQQAKQNRQPFDPAAHGFEFSTRDLDLYLVKNPQTLSHFDRL